jgi:FMN-dependent NADH-azoreductase
MSKLLAVLSSPRGDYSVSTALTHTFVDTYKQAHSGTEVVVRDLYKTDLPFVDLPWIAGAYTPKEQHSPEMEKALAISNTLIAELKAADHIVIGAPMYNFSLPAILKAWVDHIVRINETFTSSYQGLVTGKKVTVIIASGSVYTAGSPTESYNVESSYLKQVLGFIGITDVNIILAGGTGAVSAGKRSQEELLAEFKPQVEAAAKA